MKIYTANRRKIIKGFLGQGHSPALNYNSLQHQNTKSVVYSFNKVNNLFPLLTKTEYLLKSVFRSIFSLISRPIYLIKHDKVIIRLFVYLSPKIDKYLDTSTIGTSNLSMGRSVAGFAANINRFKIGNFLKFKSLRPNIIDILKSQIQSIGKQESSSLFFINFKQPTKVGESLSSATAKGGESRRPFPFPLPFPYGSGSGSGPAAAIYKYPYVSLVSNFKFKLEKLCLVFEKIFNKKVEFEIIKAQLPFQDSNILAQVLGYNANNYKFRRMLKILIPRAVIKNPSKVYLRGPATPMEEVALQKQVHDNPYLAAFIKNTDAVSPFNQQAGANGQSASCISRGVASAIRDKKIFRNETVATGIGAAALTSSYLPAFFNNKNFLKIASGIQEELLASLLRSRQKEQSISYLSGMNIKLAGRLMTQSIRPRFTVQSLQEGSLARVKVHYIEKSRFTGKNKRGAFSFTVTISHVFN
jgi:hypothetical protein